MALNILHLTKRLLSSCSRYFYEPLNNSKLYSLLLFVLLLGSYTVTNAQAPMDGQSDFNAIDPAEFLEYGTATAVANQMAIVGAPGDNNDQGAAYFITLEDGVWTQQQKVTADDREDDDLFGTSVAAYGAWVLVGAPGKTGGEGAVYLYSRVGNLLTLQTTLVSDDPTAFDHFGISVAISDTLAVIGASGYQGGKGALYIFKNQDGTWTQDAIIEANDGMTSDEFGHSVAIEGANILAGARYKDFNEIPFPVVPQAGAAYLFNWADSLWVQTTKLEASDMAAYDYFGHSVDITDDNGTLRVMIGAYGKDLNGINNTGAAYMYSGEGVWLEKKFDAPSLDIADWFGYSVGISGSIATIGSPFWNEGEGAVYIFPHAISVTANHLYASTTSAVAENYGHAVGIHDGMVMGGAYRSANTASFNAGKVGLYELVAQPIDFAASIATHELGIELTWTNRSTTADQYEIYRNDTLLVTLPATDTTYFDNDPSLQTGEIHLYCITAIDNSWGQGQSACAIGLKGSVNAPVNFTATYCDYEDRIKLDWVNNTTLAEGIFLLKSGAIIDTLPATQQNYVDTLVASLVEYDYCLATFYYQIDTLIDTIGYDFDTLGVIYEIIDPLTLDSVFVGFDLDTIGAFTDTTIAESLITSGAVCRTGKAQLVEPTIDNVTYQTYEDRVIIDWTNQSTVADSFYLYRDGYFIAAIANSAVGILGTTFTYTDFDCVSGKAHEYCLTSYKIARGESEQVCRGGGCLLFEPMVVEVSDGTYEDSIRISFIDTSFVNESFRVYRGDTTEIVMLQDDAGTPIMGSYEFFDVIDFVADSMYVYCVETLHSSLGASRQVCDTGYVTMAPPANLVATMGADGQYEDKIELTWTDKSHINDGYYIFKEGTQIATVGDIATFTDVNVVSFEQYNYCVQAYSNDLGISKKKCTIGMSEVMSPTDVIATDGTIEDFVTITWTNTSLVNHGFLLYRDGALIATVDEDVYYYYDYNATFQSIHKYEVVAFHNELGESAYISDEGHLGANSSEILAASCGGNAAEIAVFTQWALPTSNTVGAGSLLGFSLDMEVTQNGGTTRHHALVGAPGASNGQGVAYLYRPTTNDSLNWSYNTLSELQNQTFSTTSGSPSIQGDLDGVVLNQAAYGSAVAISPTANNDNRPNYIVGGPDFQAIDQYETLGSTFSGSPSAIVSSELIYPKLGDTLLVDPGNALFEFYTNTLDTASTFCPPSTHIPATCMSEPTMDGDSIMITQVSFNGDSQLSPPGCSNYEDYTATVLTTVNAGDMNITLSVTTDTCSVDTLLAAGPHTGKVYIDYNKDGDFMDADEEVATLGFATVGTQTAMIDIPITATPGILAMRIIVRDGLAALITGPCVAGTGGETEDYIIEVNSQTKYVQQNGETLIEPTLVGTTCNGMAVAGLLPVDSNLTVNDTINIGVIQAHENHADYHNHQIYTTVAGGRDIKYGEAVDVLLDGATQYMIAGGPGYSSNQGVVFFGQIDVATANGEPFTPVMGNGLIEPDDGLNIADEWGQAVQFHGIGKGFVVGAPGKDGIGAVYVFDNNGDQIQKIASPAGASSLFGAFIDIDKEVGRMIVGAPGSGEAFIYDRQADGRFNNAFPIGCGVALSGFGKAVSIDGDIAVVGIPHDDHDDPNLSNAGAVLIYEKTEIGWIENARLIAATPNENDQFGNAVAVNDGVIAIGAPYYDNGGLSDVGTIYVMILENAQEIAASDGKFDNQVEIGWTYQGDNNAIDGFLLFRDGEEIANLASNEELYFDNEAIPGKVYQYCIVAHAQDEQIKSTPFCDLGYILPNGIVSGIVSSVGASGVKDVRVCADAAEVQHSLLLNGIDEYVQITNGDELKVASNEPFSIAVWAKVEGSVGEKRSLLTSIDAEDENGYRIYVNTADQWVFEIWNDGTPTTVTGPTVVNDEWTHIAATYDGGNTYELKLYINGTLEVDNIVGTYAPNESSFLRIGGGSLLEINPPNPTPDQFFWDGKLDDISIWGAVLNQNQIDEYRQRMLRGNEPNLLAYWHFNDGEGNVLGEYSQNMDSEIEAHFGRVVGCFWHFDVPPIAYCAFTDINGEYELSNIFYSELTNFTITPSKGTHGFSPDQRVKELSLYNPDQPFVSFTDTSVFSVSGQVLYPPVAGVQCRADSMKIDVVATDGAGVAIQPVYTDAFGLYSITIPQEGEYLITPSYSVQNNNGTATIEHTFAPVNVPLYINEHIDNLDFTNTTFRNLTGSVKGACDTPIGVSTIQLSTNPGCFVLNTVTDANGVFNFIGLPPLEYNLKVTNVVKPDGQIDVNALNYFETRSRIVDLKEGSQANVALIYNRPFKVLINEELMSGGDIITPVCNDIYVLKQGTPYDVEIDIQQLFVDGVCPGDSGTLYITDNISDVGTVSVRFGLPKEDNTSPKTRNMPVGKIFYTMIPGNPIVAAPYEKGLTVAAVVDGDGALTPPVSIEAIIEGHKSLTGTFTTALDHIQLVLRDPPGDQSYSYAQKNQDYCRVQQFGMQGLISAQADVWLGIGAKIDAGTFLGLGGGVNVELTGGSLNQGPHGTLNMGGGASIGAADEMCLSFAEDYSTSDSPLLVGEKGDVYIGYGRNYFYNKTFETTYNTATCEVNVSDGINIAKGTEAQMFFYTRYHIDNYLIPSFKDIAENIIIPSGVPDFASQFIRDGAIIQAERWAEEVALADRIRKYSLSGGSLSGSITVETSDFIFDQNSETFQTITVPKTYDLNTLKGRKDYLSLNSFEIGFGATMLDRTKEVSGLYDYDNLGLIQGGLLIGAILVAAAVPAIGIPLIAAATILGPFATVAIASTIAAADNGAFDKVNALEGSIPIENYSFHAGTIINNEYSIATNFTREQATIMQFEAGLGYKLEAEVKAVGFDSKLELDAMAVTSVESASGESFSEGKGSTVGFVLDDSGTDGDFFSIDIAPDFIYGTPIFGLVGGRTSCPQEVNPDFPLTTPGTNPSSNNPNNFIQARDSVTLQLATGYTAFQQVPVGEPAVFVLNITNESNSLDQREYMVRPMMETFQGSPIPIMNGVALEGGTPVTFWLDPLVPTQATLVIEQGPEENYYPDLKIVAYPACESALWGTNFILFNNDTLSLSILWESPCTQPDIAVPDATAGWFINNVTNSVIFPQNTTPYILPVAFDGYDLETDSIINASGILAPNFVGAEFQYREANSGSPWIAEPISYEALETAFLNDPGVPPNYTYFWNTANLADGEYEMRVKTNCQQPAPNGSVSYSETISGVIDRNNVALFGAPEPADGVLTNGENVVVNFNQQIDCSLCTSVPPCFLQNITTLVNLSTGDTLQFDLTPDMLGDYNVQCGGVNGNQLMFDIYDVGAFEGDLLQVTISSLLDASNTFIAVRDLSGNMVDPDLNGIPNDISWSFVVQYNDVYFDPPAVAATIYEGDVHNAIVELDNISSGAQAFTLDYGNLPMWMGIDQVPSTQISPSGDQDISLFFNLLDIMLPDSTYTHNLTAAIDDLPFYDSNGDGIASNDTSYIQTLPISITVLAAPPTWEVNPADFAYSMNMIVEFDIDATLSTDVFDQVGAFVDGELRGFTNMEYVAPLAQQSGVNPYLAFLTVYSNVPVGEEVSFQIWDATPGILYGARIDSLGGEPTVDFDSAVSIGELGNPETLYAGREHVVCNDLNPGWNLISFNVTAADMSVNAVLAGLNAANGDIVKTQNQDGSLSDVSMYDATSNSWLGTIDSFTNDQAYYIKTQNGGELCVAGMPIDTDNTSINLVAGWNGMPFLLQDEAPIGNALLNLAPTAGDQVIDPYTGTFANYDGGSGSWIGNLDFLQPGAGYLYNAQNSTGFTFAESTTLDWAFNSADYQYSMNVIGRIEMDAVPSFDTDDMVGAFVNGEARGHTQNVFLPELGIQYVMLTVYSNDISGSEAVEFRVYDASEDTVYNSIATVNLTRDHVEGNFANPHIFTVYTCGQVSITTTPESCVAGNDGTATVHTVAGCGTHGTPCLSNAAEFSVGNSATGNEDVTPFQSAWEDARFQYLFKAEELLQAGINAGTLSSIGFNVLEKNSIQPYNNFTIKIKCTSNNNLSTGAFAPSLKTVYQGNVSTQPGWNVFAFDQTYDWDGTTNLIVEFCYDNDSYSFFNDKVATSATNFTAAAGFYDDNGTGCSFTNAAYTFNERPDVKFGACISTFQWDGGQTTATVEGLSEGVYSVAVTLPNSCSITTSVVVGTESMIDLTAGELKASCAGANTGEAQVHISGGTPPYTVAWSNGATTNFIGNLSAGVYTVVVTDAELCEETAQVTIHSLPVSNCSAVADIRVFLEGPYVANHSMSTALKAYGLLPLTQPYNTAPWNYAGTESVTSFPANAVDWILVEARSASNMDQVVAQKAAILLQNGYVQDIDGTAGVRFDNMPNGSYYVVVRHRNHLGAMSAMPMSLPNQFTYNFSASSTQALGANQMTEVESGVFALFAGDINNDGVITIADFNMYQTEASSFNQYLPSDCNLNRAVTVADFNVYQDNASVIGISQIRY